MTGRAGSLGYSGGTDRRTRVIGRQDSMLAVAICANRRIRFSLGGQLAVYAIPIIMLDIAVASAAGLGNIEMVNR